MVYYCYNNDYLTELTVRNLLIKIIIIMIKGPLVVVLGTIYIKYIIMQYSGSKNGSDPKHMTTLLSLNTL